MKLSILMTAYNCEKFLKESISSVLRSSFKNFELIIIDDGSTDNTRNILHKFKQLDPRIKLFLNDLNQGIAKSKNFGLTKCHGELIAMMDADDICTVDRFEKQVNFMDDNSDLDISGTSCFLFSNDVTEISLKVVHQTELEKKLLIENVFNHPTLIIRRCLVDKGLFVYDSRFKYTEDYKLWTELAYKVNFGNLTAPLLYYRFTTHSASARAPIRRELEIVLIRIQYLGRKIMNKNFTLSDLSKFLATILKSTVPCIVKALTNNLRFGDR